MELSVLKYTGEETGRKIQLAENIFCIEPHKHAVYLDVKLILANRRQGTHKAKERSEIKGSTKKLRKQKGGGTARVGSIKSPLFRGGGRTFGPKPRQYGFKLNKKTRQLARRSVLSYKLGKQNIRILENFSFDSPKTKQYISMLQNLNVINKKTLLVLDTAEKNIILSGRNLKNATTILADQINTYDLLHADCILFSERSIEKIEKNLQ